MIFILSCRHSFHCTECGGSCQGKTAYLEGVVFMKSYIADTTYMTYTKLSISDNTYIYDLYGQLFGDEVAGRLLDEKLSGRSQKMGPIHATLAGSLRSAKSVRACAPSSLLPAQPIYAFKDIQRVLV